VSESVRIAEPLRTHDGEWVCEGWSATRWVSGSEPDYSRDSTWVDIVQAGEAFHRAVAHLSRPACLEAREDPWARADRAAWGEQDLRIHPGFSDVAVRLREAFEPLGQPQVVHLDLTANTLFEPGSAPAVIDVSPYWRPPAYAYGVVLADALCWYGAEARLLEQTGVSVPAVARALVFRMLTSSELAWSRQDLVDVDDEAARYRRAAGDLGL
jgi:hypothetical protein